MQVFLIANVREFPFYPFWFSRELYQNHLAGDQRGPASF